MDGQSPEKLNQPGKTIIPPEDPDQVRAREGLIEYVGSKPRSTFYGGPTTIGEIGASSILGRPDIGNPPRRAIRGMGHPTESS